MCYILASNSVVEHYIQLFTWCSKVDIYSYNFWTRGICMLINPKDGVALNEVGALLVSYNSGP